MITNSTILTEKESSLLENLILKYGFFVDFDQIVAELGGYSRQRVRKLVAKMSKNGWLIRIKKGKYYISNLEARGFASASVFVIAKNIMEDSYVSFESALQHHGIFDQYLKRTTSVSVKQYASKEIQNVTYKFVKTGAQNFYGWENIKIEGETVKMATVEKAVLDMINFHRSVNSLDLVLEKFKEYEENFDFQKLQEFSEKQSTAVRRVLGFLLDKAGIDSGNFLELIKGEKGSSWMTKDSKIYNAKWKLYYHNHFE